MEDRVGRKEVLGLGLGHLAAVMDEWFCNALY